MKLRYPQVLLFLCAFGVLPATVAAVKLDTPVGGWRTGAPEGEGEKLSSDGQLPGVLG